MARQLPNVKRYLLSGVSYAIPFVACGGIMIATATALVPMTPTGPDFSHAPFLKMILDIGSAAFSLLVPVLAGYIAFGIGPTGPGEANVVVCRGQKISLPPQGSFNRLYLLAAAVGGDRPAEFAVDGRVTRLLVPDWAEPVGQWNSRIVAGDLVQDADRIAPAYAKSATVAWTGTHRHDLLGQNEAYVFTNVFRLRLDLPEGARALTLPDDDRIRILAATMAHNENDDVFPAQPFADPARGAVVHVVAPGPSFLDRTSVTLMSPNPGATIRYTLDGSEPTPASTAYTEPLRLERTTTVRARAFAPGLDDGLVATATFTRVTPREPAGVARDDLSPGLACRTYEGDWRHLPDFSALTPTGSLTLATVGLPPDRSADHLGMVCEGFLEVPADGLYTFALRSSEASELLVDGRSVVLDDTIDFITRRGQAALAKGLHAVELRYVHRSFVAGLALKVDAPGKPLAPIAPERLFHLEGGR